MEPGDHVPPLEKVAPVGHERAAHVHGLVAGHGAAEPVGERRGELAYERHVLVELAEINHVQLFGVHLLYHCRDVRRVFFQVAVQRHDSPALGVVEPGLEGYGLAHVFGQGDGAKLGEPAGQAF